MTGISHLSFVIFIADTTLSVSSVKVQTRFVPKSPNVKSEKPLKIHNSGNTQKTLLQNYNSLTFSSMNATLQLETSPKMQIRHI